MRGPLLYLAVWCLWGSFSVYAQAEPGTYSILSLGTRGSHAKDPGIKGVMTLANTGAVSGSIYSYDERKTTVFRGSVNLRTGRGSITDGIYIFDLNIKTSSKTYLDITYSKRGYNSRGIIWGVR